MKESLFQVDEQYSFWRNYGKCKKTQRHQTCNNREKKKLFSVRTKLLQHKVFSEILLAIEMTKTQMFMNKPVYLSLSILDLSKKAMYEFLYDYIKPKYKENQEKKENYVIWIRTVLLSTQKQKTLQKMLK